MIGQLYSSSSGSRATLQLWRSSRQRWPEVCSEDMTPQVVNQGPRTDVISAKPVSGQPTVGQPSAGFPQSSAQPLEVWSPLVLWRIYAEYFPRGVL